MTKSQRMSILLDRWPKACAAQGWDKNDRALRLQTISDAIGRQVKTMNDLDNSADVDKVFAHLGLLSNNLALATETVSQPSPINSQPEAGYRRRILWLVNKHGHALGGVPYVLSLARDKFHITAGLSTIEDLSTEQLHQLMMTLAARKSRRDCTAAPRPNSNYNLPVPSEIHENPYKAKL